LLRAIGRFLHVDGADRLDTWRALLDHGEAARATDTDALH
jgi:hypothetical protein